MAQWLKKTNADFFFGENNLFLKLGIVLVEPHDEHSRFLNEARDDFWDYLICQIKKHTKRAIGSRYRKPEVAMELW